MDLRLIAKDTQSIEIEVINENETLLAGLRNTLLHDEKVVFATYVLGHPLLEHPKVIVKVNEGKPQTALKRAAKALANDYREFATLFEREQQQVL